MRRNLRERAGSDRRDAGSGLRDDRSGGRNSDQPLLIDGERVQDATDSFGAMSHLQENKTSNVAIEVAREHKTFDLQATIAAPKSKAGTDSQI